MKTKIFPVLLLFVMYLAQSCNDPETAHKYNYETQADVMALDFVNNAIEGGRTEIKASMLAEKISQNPQVVDFAKMMVKDHTDGVTELKKLKKEKLILKADSISEDHEEMIDSLSKLTGGAFDKAYMEMMVKDHEGAVKLFDEGAEVTAPHIKSFAIKTLPTIEKHRDDAKQILASLK